MLAARAESKRSRCALSVTPGACFRVTPLASAEGGIGKSEVEELLRKEDSCSPHQPNSLGV